MRFIIYGSSSTFFRLVCTTLASDKEAYVDFVPNPYMLRPVPYFVAFYWLRLRRHQCGYVTRSHIGVRCGISSCSCYVVCKTL